MPDPRPLVDVAAKWASGLAPAADVVDVATDVLVSGIESTSLVLLAGVTRSEADYEVHDLLPRAMEELGLPYFGWDQPNSRLLAAAALCREDVNGSLPARDLCRMIHSRFGHDAHELIEPVAVLDDEFDVLDYFHNPTEQQLDARTLDAARRLVTFADQLTFAG